MSSEWARLFDNGGSQAVRLPREFRFKGDRVRIRRKAKTVLLQPMFTDAYEWLFEVDAVRTKLSGKKQKSSTKRVRRATSAAK